MYCFQYITLTSLCVGYLYFGKDAKTHKMCRHGIPNLSKYLQVQKKYLLLHVTSLTLLNKGYRVLRLLLFVLSSLSSTVTNHLLLATRWFLYEPRNFHWEVSNCSPHKLSLSPHGNEIHVFFFKTSSVLFLRIWPHFLSATLD